MKTRLITFQIEILRSRASGQHRTFSLVLLLPDTITPRLFELYLIHFHLGKATLFTTAMMKLGTEQSISFLMTGSIVIAIYFECTMLFNLSII